MGVFKNVLVLCIFLLITCSIYMFTLSIHIYIKLNSISISTFVPEYSLMTIFQEIPKEMKRSPVCVCVGKKSCQTILNINIDLFFCCVHCIFVFRRSFWTCRDDWAFMHLITFLAVANTLVF